MNKSIVFLFFSLLLGLQLKADDTNKGILTINIDSLKSNNGFVIVKLYDTNCTKFPDTQSAISIIKATIENKKAQIHFTDLPFGIYAFTVYHDENNNGLMDSQLIRIITEGYAFSNDQRITIGPPSFDKASFIFNEKHLSINLRLIYEINNDH